MEHLLLGLPYDFKLNKLNYFILFSGLYFNPVPAATVSTAVILWFFKISTENAAYKLPTYIAPNPDSD